MKKILIGLVLLPLMVLADTIKIGDVTWSYTVENGKVTVTGADPSSGALEIPSVLNGYSVTGIGDYAFRECSGLTSVTIPSSVTSIGWGAFEYCSGLTSVTISEGVMSIGGCAFGGCDSLTSIMIPSSVTSIDDLAFEGCGVMSFMVDAANPNYSSLNGLLCSKDGKTLIFCVSGNVTIPEGVTSIGMFAFRGCGLIEVTIPGSVYRIPVCCFDGCPNLKSVTIQKGVGIVEEHAFYNCEQLETVICAAAVVDRDSFSGCYRLSTIKLAESVADFSCYIMCEIIDFEGKPPRGWWENKMSCCGWLRVRYNVKYKDVWEAEIARAEEEAGVSHYMTFESYEVESPSEERMTEEQTRTAKYEMAVKSDGKLFSEEKYAAACETYGVTPQTKPEVVPEGSVAVTKESLSAANIETVEIKDGKITIGITVESTSSLDNPDWKPAAATTVTVDLPGVQSGFIRLMSTDAGR